MRSMSAKHRGFSLIELVIVIVILGIIAAVAIPRLSSGSRNASDTALQADLWTLRNAIDWYFSEHYNTFPGAKTAGAAYGAAGSQEALVSQLTMYSNAKGECSEDKSDDYPFGPYIRGNFPEIPVGSNAGTDDVTVTDATGPLAADGSSAWMYSHATGQIIANTTDDSTTGDTYDTF